jgi:hypothetical protein
MVRFWILMALVMKSSTSSWCSVVYFNLSCGTHRFAVHWKATQASEHVPPSPGSKNKQVASSMIPASRWFSVSWFNDGSHNYMFYMPRESKETHEGKYQRKDTLLTSNICVLSTGVVLNPFCSCAPRWNFSSAFYPQCCSCIIQVRVSCG